jgi:Leucine-rich repeat (LRR) protein/mono/diheme cytochrome c family protein
MKDLRILYFVLVGLMTFTYPPADAQENIAEQAYNIFRQNCFTCHGPSGSFREALLIDHAALIDSGVVVPGNAPASEFYKRLVDGTPEKPQMPSGQPALSLQALETIRLWISQGAPDWQTEPDVDFIPPAVMLTTIEEHLETLSEFNRPFARYFTITHLYNAGDSQETLRAYKIALSKLINSLSWGYHVINPEPIDDAETIFYIDLRDYEWDVRGDAWTQIENVYPYTLKFDPETQAVPHRKLVNLRQQMKCKEPYVYADWFIATAALPPLYHDILDLPTTDSALESQLGVDVARNLESAPGRRVWRAGFNDSGVSEHNRVVERHTSQHGAYWKSYDFAGSVGAQNVFTHPLSFRQDGGEMIFNLPNGLQAYMIVDALGNRIDVAPTDIVANPAASDPAVRNGLSCIGCHTEGMKPVEDEVRSAIERAKTPAYDKAQALRLYVPHAEMERYVQQDTERYKVALEATGDTFGGLVEPVHRFHEVYRSALDARHAAAAVGLQTDAFLSEIDKKPSLQNLGLTRLLSGGNVQRDTWTDIFQPVMTALNTKYIPPTLPSAPTITSIVGGNGQLTINYNAPINIGNGGPILRYEYSLNNGIYLPLPNNRIITGLTNGTTYAVRLRAVSGSGYGTPSVPVNATPIRKDTDTDTDDNDYRFTFPVPDANLRVAIAEALGKASGASITETDMQRLTHLHADEQGIRDLTGLEHATRLERIELRRNEITDLTPIAGLTRLNNIKLRGNRISDVAPLAELTSVDWLGLEENAITDLSPLKGLIKLNGIGISGNPVTNVAPLASLISLERIDAWRTPITDFSPLAKLPSLSWIEFGSDGALKAIPTLKGLKALRRLQIDNTNISDLSALSELTGLEWLRLVNNTISDVSALADLKRLKHLNLDANIISDVAPLAKLSRLEVLYLENNAISDPAPLAALKNLDRLDLRNNVISDFSALAALPDTTFLRLEGNPGMPSGGPKITGPWLWAIVPGTALNANTDFLARATRNATTELKVATHGAKEGKAVGEGKWRLHTLSASGRDNINQMTEALGWGSGEEIYDHIVYGSVILDAPEEQETTMFVGSDDACKVWLNGELIHSAFVDRGADDYQDFFPATLKAGKNALLVALDNHGHGGFSGFFGFAPDAKYTVFRPSMNFVFQTDTPAEEVAVGDTLTLHLNAENVDDLGGWQADLTFDPKVLKAVSVTEGDFLKQGEDGKTFFQKGSIKNPLGKIIGIKSLQLDGEAVKGLGRLVSVTFTAIREGTSEITLDNFLVGTRRGEKTRSIAPEMTITVGGARAAPEAEEMRPDQTALLTNYPNPFNPETWIPYQLTDAADVTMTIYATDGKVVRTLILGHQPAGYYTGRSRAAYWDGRNTLGERVASGVYFYTLTAGDFTATRKMLIRK